MVGTIFVFTQDISLTCQRFLSYVTCHCVPGKPKSKLTQYREKQHLKHTKKSEIRVNLKKEKRKEKRKKQKAFSLKPSIKKVDCFYKK
jgi:uncharacterized protein YlxW (UPF0749 family)